MYLFFLYVSVRSSTHTHGGDQTEERRIGDTFHSETSPNQEDSVSSLKAWKTDRSNIGVVDFNSDQLGRTKHPTDSNKFKRLMRNLGCFFRTGVSPNKRQNV